MCLWSVLKHIIWCPYHLSICAHILYEISLFSLSLALVLCVCLCMGVCYIPATAWQRKAFTSKNPQTPAWSSTIRAQKAH